MKQNDHDLLNTGGVPEDAGETRLPMYTAESIQKPGAGSHQMTTGDATRVEDASDTRVKNDSGPEHFAPVNPTFSSSFDEYAGEFAGEVLLADRDESDYPQHEESHESDR